MSHQLIKLINRFNSQPLKKRYQQILFSGVIVSTSLILLLSMFHAGRIPDQLRDQAVLQLDKRPWLGDLIHMDGRNLHFIGQLEAESGLENEMQVLRDVAGIRNVYNHLEESPKPVPYFRLRKVNDGLYLAGQLQGDHLDNVLSQLSSVFGDMEFSDRIRIDDRLGRPLWLDGFAESAGHLTNLEEFELHGWRDQLLITGRAPDTAEVRRIGYSLPVPLIPQVNIQSRLHVKPKFENSNLGLTADWSGVAVAGTVASQQEMDELLAAIKSNFGTVNFSHQLQIKPEVQISSAVRQLIDLMPALVPLRDLRMETSNTGFQIWGRADNPGHLGLLLTHIHDLGLEEHVICDVVIDPGQQTPFLSLFSDQRRATLMGVLPSQKIREDIVASTKQKFDLLEVNDLLSVEPNVRVSDWIENWQSVLQLLPAGPSGISIDSKNVLLTGNSRSQAELEKTDGMMARIFPDHRRLNWINSLSNTGG